MALVAVPSKSSTVFVGNIPYDTTEDDIRELFSKHGKVESFRMVFDKDTRQPKGYGFCDFVDNETAVRAMKALAEVECNGRKLRLDLADNVLRGPARPAAARPALPNASSIGSGSGMLALSAGGESTSRPRLSAPPQLPAPIKTSGTTEATGIIKPATVDPATASAAVAGDVKESPEATIAAVEAHTAIAQTIAAMPQAQLMLCLGTMQELARSAPEQARASLQENPQLCYALLHAQFILGLSMSPALPPDMNETQELRAESVQRAMANQKQMAAACAAVSAPPPRPVPPRQDLNLGVAGKGMVVPPPKKRAIAPGVAAPALTMGPSTSGVVMPPPPPAGSPTALGPATPGTGAVVLPPRK
eukprot:TRINITY_DN64371_c0_g1_i1.p1 TRINITY_DN64371_c0_g1~~TRINITY_DN64371_c0_g1_i1.p1  ORF type:complete len:388 (+),score=76.51 TRINITY_DN64371_c0_g1_i1:84-1166(+)